MARSTDDMIRDLVSDLPPVTPMRRLREIVLLALGISLPFYIYRLVTAGVNGTVAGQQAPSAAFLWVSIILILISAGGLLAGLAGAIPGREKTSRIGIALMGASLAVGAGVFGYSVMFGVEPFVETAKGSVPCAMGAATLSIPAVLLAVRFVAQGAAFRTTNAMAFAAAGAMGAAAVIVHATCPHPKMLHLVMGHGLAPLAGGLFVLVCASIFFSLSRMGSSVAAD